MNTRGSDRRRTPGEGLVRRHPASPRPRLKPELRHVHSTDPWPGTQNCTANTSLSKDLDTVSSRAESMHTEPAPRSDSDPSDPEESGNNEGPHSKNSHSAHSGRVGRAQGAGLITGWWMALSSGVWQADSLLSAACPIGTFPCVPKARCCVSCKAESC